MVFGMSTACFFPHTYIEDAVSLIGSMGVRSLEVFFSCFSEYRKPFVSELKTRACDSGVDIFSVHAYSLSFEPQLFSRHERARHEALGIFESVLEAGAALGAGIYVFHGPVHLKKSQSLLLDYEAVAARVHPLAELAKAYNIRLAWENVHYCWYDQPCFPERIAPYLETDNLVFTLDIKQAAQAGYAPADFIAPAASRLANIHICDYAYDSARGIVPKLPFDGCMDFCAFKTALETAGYNGALIFEVYEENYAAHTELFDSFKCTEAFFDKA